MYPCMCIVLASFAPSSGSPLSCSSVLLNPRRKTQSAARCRHGPLGIRNRVTSGSLVRQEGLLHRIGPMRSFRERRLDEVQSAPVRWAGISLAVASLRVATPCYTTEQRTLLGRGVTAPRRCCHAALECLEPGSVCRLLRRTSENASFFYAHYDE